MQNITDKEFEREVEALKSHRRISVNRPILDPDLPDMAAIRGGGQEIMAAAGGSPSPPLGTGTLHAGSEASGQALSRAFRRVGVDLTDDGPASNGEPYLTRGSGRQAFTARRRGQASPSDAAPPPSTPNNSSRSTGTRPRSPITSDSSTPLGRPSDPSHLFWVPASVHPELSPSHFREFLQEHASRAAREHDPVAGTATGSSPHSQFGVVASVLDPARPGGSASPSGSPHAEMAPPISFVPRTSIARRGSTLRRQYRPDYDNDDDEQHTPSPRSGPSMRNRDGEPSMSISDLQKLEALAEEATKSRDENELRSVLRRTMSLGAGTSTMDTVDAVPAAGDDTDAPIIVPPPGQILRRAARTKIRKSSMSGSPETAERAVRIASVRRRAATDQECTSRPTSEAPDYTGDDRPSKSNLTAVAMTLMERRDSDASELSSNEDENVRGASPARPISDGATDSIVDAYSRDSLISDTSQTTSFTSVAESDTIDAHQDKLPTKALQESPPGTPTPTGTTPSATGYFDLTSRKMDTEHAPSPSTDEKRGVLSESPLQSPEYEYPLATQTLDPRSSNQSLTEHAWPIPVSRVLPVPSFEKARPQSSIAQQLPVQQSQRQGQQQQQKSVAPVITASQQKSRQTALPATPNLASVPLTPNRSKDKEKRSGGFASWFGIGKDEEESKHSKEDKKRDRHHRREREKEEEATSLGHTPSASASPAKAEHIKEKDKDVGSFLGALFGKKKGNDDGKDAAYLRNQENVTAGSLLDQRGMATLPGGGRLVNGHFRYPIHVERAVYRLSHIKLANPRRPLYEQVLISNLMFWYLSIVNRSQQQQQAQAYEKQQLAQLQSDKDPAVNIPPVSVATPSSGIKGTTGEGGNILAGGGSASLGVVSAEMSMGGATTPSASSIETSTALASSEGSSDLISVIKQAAPQKTRKGGLVKPNRAPGGRPAEQPILAAGYGAQHRQINDDLALAQQQQQQQHYSLPANISVGQVIDPRILQYAYQKQTSPGSILGKPRQGGADDGKADSSQHQRTSGGSTSPSTSPRTSPTMIARRSIGRSASSGTPGGNNTAEAQIIGSSGAWLGSGGAASGSSALPVSMGRSKSDWANNGSGSLERAVDAVYMKEVQSSNLDSATGKRVPGLGDSEARPEARSQPGKEEFRLPSVSRDSRRLGYRVGSVGDLRQNTASSSSSTGTGSKGMSASSSSPSLAPYNRDSTTNDGRASSPSYRSVSGPTRHSSQQQDARSAFPSAIDAARQAQSRRL